MSNIDLEARELDNDDNAEYAAEREKGINRLRWEFESERAAIGKAQSNDVILDFIGLFRTGKVTSRLQNAEISLGSDYYTGTTINVVINGQSFELKLTYKAENFGGEESVAEMAEKAYDAGQRAKGY